MQRIRKTSDGAVVDKLPAVAGLFTALCLMIVVGACGGPATALPGQAPADALAPPADGHTAAGFHLEVLPETYLGGAPQGEFRLDVSLSEGATAVRVLGTGLRDLRAFYAQLHTPAGWVVESAQAGAGLGAAADVLSLCRDTAGAVQLGAVLISCDTRGGVSGAAELARVVLRPGTGAVRRASGVPAETALHPKLWVNCTTKRIEWDTRLTGDYNQDGIVGVTDLTPLAVHWGDAPVVFADSIPRYVLDSIQDVVDGNADEQIGIADLSVIGVNGGKNIAGWNLYRSLTPAADFPDVDLDDPLADGGVASKIARFAYRSYGALAVGDKAHERQRFSIDLPLFTDGMAYWVRPVSGGMEGAPSNWSPYDSSLAHDVTARVDPETYDETTTGVLEFEVSTVGPDVVEGVFWAREMDGLNAAAASVYFSGAVFDYTPAPDRGAFVDFAGNPIAVEYSLEIPDEVLMTTDTRVDPLKPELSGTFRTWRCTLARSPQIVQYVPGPAGFGPGRGVREHDLSFNSSASTLTWYYAARGDCNQNGVSSDGDLLLIDRNFGDFGNFLHTSKLYMVDGDHDDHINIADVPVVGFNYRLAVSGYNIYTSLDPAVAPVDQDVLGDPGIAPLGYVSFKQAQGDRAMDRLHFSFAIPAPQPGMYLWVQPEYRGAIGGVSQGDCIQLP